MNVIDDLISYERDSIQFERKLKSIFLNVRLAVSQLNPLPNTSINYYMKRIYVRIYYLINLLNYN